MQYGPGHLPDSRDQKRHCLRYGGTLIGRGYLTRETDGKDRRMQRLYSTAEATPLVQAGQEAQRRFEEAIRQGLTDGELETYAALTQKLLEHIDRLSQELSR